MLSLLLGAKTATNNGQKNAANEVFSTSDGILFAKNFTVKLAWLGAILGWVTSWEVFSDAHE